MLAKLLSFAVAVFGLISCLVFSDNPRITKWGNFAQAVATVVLAGYAVPQCLKLAKGQEAGRPAGSTEPATSPVEVPPVLINGDAQDAPPLAVASPADIEAQASASTDARPPLEGVTVPVESQAACPTCEALPSGIVPLRGYIEAQPMTPIMKPGSVRPGVSLETLLFNLGCCGLTSSSHLHAERGGMCILCGANDYVCGACAANA
jgi:hypothetical protein